MTKESRATYRLHENIAGIVACVHADDRLSDHIEKTEQSFTERLEWCIDAAHKLVAAEPEDYEAADLDWYDVTDAVADGFYEGLGPEAAAKAALSPTVEVESVPDGALAALRAIRDARDHNAKWGRYPAIVGDRCFDGWAADLAATAVAKAEREAAAPAEGRPL